jgi:hypothetical protein
MGLFIEQQQPKQELVDLFRAALQQQPPADPQTQAARTASTFQPLVRPLATALATPQPADPDTAAKAAQEQVTAAM